VCVPPVSEVLAEARQSNWAIYFFNSLLYGTATPWTESPKKDLRGQFFASVPWRMWMRKEMLCAPLYLLP